MSFMVKISLQLGEGIDIAKLHWFYKSNAIPVVLSFYLMSKKNILPWI